jgi:hypothetical protein
VSNRVIIIAVDHCICRCMFPPVNLYLESVEENIQKFDRGLSIKCMFELQIGVNSLSVM